MTREATERGLAKRTAQAMRAAAIRLARARAEEEADPALAYGCVDWFRYDVKTAPQEVDARPPPATRQPAPGRGGISAH